MNTSQSISTMNDHHPITPPPELVQQWLGNYFGNVINGELSELEKYLATQAAQWGYDQRGKVNEAELQEARDEELEACCELLKQKGVPAYSMLRAYRRPPPPTLKEQALKAAHIELDPQGKNGSLIIRALEGLPDD